MISQYWLWRWLFWRRVGCHFRGCGKPAIWKCVYRGVTADGAFGEEYARDPLCAKHGKAGPCPTERNSIHAEIPETQRWYRVHFRVRIGWEGAAE